MDQSDLATSCSSEKNDTLVSVMTNDAIRYKKKGIYLTI